MILEVFGVLRQYQSNQLKSLFTSKGLMADRLIQVVYFRHPRPDLARFTRREGAWIKQVFDLVAGATTSMLKASLIGAKALSSRA